MMAKARTQTLSYSAMGAIWPSTKVLHFSSIVGLRADRADCYGVPYIPEGQWLCRKCTVSPENPVVSYPRLESQSRRS